MDIIELRKIFSEKLSDLMSESGFDSITLFAKKISIPRTTISNWLNLTRSPQIDSLVVLAKFFNVTTDYLLGLEL